MTTTYDPRHGLYTDEYDVRLETARVFDVCTSCRLCVSLCPTFPTLISHVQEKIDTDAGRLTPDEQDEVMQQCFRCSMCVTVCPYTPDQHEHAIDFPHLVDRYRAMQKKNKTLSMHSRIGHAILGRSWQSVQILARLQPNGVWRRLIARTFGISSRIELPRRASQSFSAVISSPRAVLSKHVSVFPTCVVETVRPEIGRALVDVYEHHGFGCSLVAPDRCCGAPALLHGEVGTFIKNAKRNVDVLIGVVRNGNDIVVPNPSCFSVITTDYPHYLDTDDARLVASHTFEALSYLAQIVEANDQTIGTHLSETNMPSLTHHVPMEMHAQVKAKSGRTLLSLAGAVIPELSLNTGYESGWHFHVDNEAVADELSAQFREKIEATGAEVVVSDSPWVAGMALHSAQPRVLQSFEVIATANEEAQ